MGIPAEYKPLPGPSSDRWEKWTDLVELNWHNAMEAARGEYAGIRAALQASAVSGETSRVDRKERHLPNE